MFNIFILTTENICYNNLDFRVTFIEKKNNNNNNNNKNRAGSLLNVNSTDP